MRHLDAGPACPPPLAARAAGRGSPAPPRPARRRRPAGRRSRARRGTWGGGAPRIPWRPYPSATAPSPPRCPRRRRSRPACQHSRPGGEPGTARAPAASNTARPSKRRAVRPERAGAGRQQHGTGVHRLAAIGAQHERTAHRHPAVPPGGRAGGACRTARSAPPAARSGPRRRSPDAPGCRRSAFPDTAPSIARRPPASASISTARSFSMPHSKAANRPTGPAPTMATSVSMISLMRPEPSAGSATRKLGRARMGGKAGEAGGAQVRTCMLASDPPIHLTLPDLAATEALGARHRVGAAAGGRGAAARPARRRQVGVGPGADPRRHAASRGWMCRARPTRWSRNTTRAPGRCFISTSGGWTAPVAWWSWDGTRRGSASWWWNGPSGWMRCAAGRRAWCVRLSEAADGRLAARVRLGRPGPPMTGWRIRSRRWCWRPASARGCAR